MKALRSRRALLLLSVAGVAGAGVAAASSPAVAPAVLAWRQTHAVHTTATTSALKVAAATPKAHCGKGSLPETGIQGRVPLADYSNGRAAKGYLCNAVEASHIGTTGGFKTFRYTDRTGRVCAFYDGTLLYPTAAVHGEAGGVHVLDMSDPNRPVETARLLTPAMDSPHESLALNPLRGLLAAGMGSPATAPGIVDVYDVSQDCRHPVLQSSTPLGILGHESGFSPDGRTLWISTTAQPGVTAIDVSNPVLPSIVWHSFSYTFHGMNLSADGNRLYGADLGNSGLAILDVSQVQRRVANPQVTEVSHLTWPEVSIPQNTIPVTIKGHKYLIEFDEYSRGTSTAADMPVGAGRIINIDDDRHPRVVSNLRLQVNQPAARAGDQVNDPGQYPVQGYAAHYCGVPRTTDPGIVACSFILSGLRVFDISDPLHPKEAAYFNKPAPNLLPLTSGAYAMSAPSFDIKRQSVWYADGDSGFYTVRLTNGAWPKTLR
ncbi:MAG: LVIVD repeat-containing protein [Mycobacteriales bacterium]